MAASAQRYPRDILLETDAEYQRLQSKHSKYEAELQKLSATPYLNSEDLLEEIKLKKMKLYCKDEMERIASRIQARSHFAIAHRSNQTTPQRAQALWLSCPALVASRVYLFLWQSVRSTSPNRSSGN